MKVAAGCPLAGHSLAHSQIHRDLGIVVVGIVRPDGELLYNPPPDTVVEAEAVLIALGQRRHLERLEKLAVRGPV